LKFRLTSSLALICLASIARADVATLKNGDRVTGDLLTIKGGTLQLKTANLGVVSIPMAQVATYSVEKPVAVVIKGQKPVYGTLTLLPSGEWQVKAANGQTQTIAAAKPELIMPEGDYQKVEQTPAVWQAWKGAASLGYSLQNGNQETNTLTPSITATRERPETPIFEPHWRTHFDFTTLFSHAEQKSLTPPHTITSTVTSRTLTTDLRQDYLFSAANFAFVFGQANHVSTQDLYLQQTYGGGIGRDVVKNARTTFSVLGGLTYVQEKFFNGLNTRTAQVLVGEALGEQFTKRLRLDHYLHFYPDVIHGGQYRFDTSAVFSFKLTTKLLVNASVIDLYLSNPPAGEKNNITFSMGIGYSF
jgi:putative salt-induced outer membrane protein YdiY